MAYLLPFCTKKQQKNAMERHLNYSSQNNKFKKLKKE